ncbi:glycosyltransferase, partial [Patescibacteria group bacterium]
WINESLGQILPYLCKKYKVIHQAGLGQLDEFRVFVNKNYKVYGQLEPDEMTNILSQADIVVSRAGANTVSELVVLKKPCILVPIPWSYLDEQNNNAKYAQRLGLARVLSQKNLSPKKLEKEIENLVTSYPKIISSTNKTPSLDIHAAEKLVDLLQKYIKN